LIELSLGLAAGRAFWVFDKL
jgi:hypothetical protein